MKILFLCLLCLVSSISANSLKLYNNSPYKLRAVVRAADGTYLGEMMLLPMTYNTWTDSYAQFGPIGGRSAPGPTRSQTPYTVLWYCLDGSTYSTNVQMATGMLVIAQVGDGPKICKPEPNTPPELLNPGARSDVLPYENEVPQNPYMPGSPYNPENPNSAISPQSPYNPSSPYNPNNPDSPYNPKNPQSPYYKPPQQGATGAAPPNG